MRLGLGLDAHFVQFDSFLINDKKIKKFTEILSYPKFFAVEFTFYIVLILRLSWEFSLKRN